jgi:aminoglycoside phosphotransferase (APT) family kinase protein
MITNSRELFLVNIGLIHVGANFHNPADGQISQLIENIRALDLPTEVTDWFSKARTGQVEVNPFYPHGSNLAAACFFLQDWKLDNDAFYSFLEECGTCDPIGESDFRTWMERFSEVLSHMLSLPGVIPLWQEYENLVADRSEQWRDMVVCSQNLINGCYGSNAPELAFCPNLFNQYLADFVLSDNRIIVIAAEPNAEAMLHEALHPLIAECRPLFMEYAEKHDITLFADEAAMLRMGYMADASAESKVHILEESFVRALSVTLSGNGSERADFHKNSGFCLTAYLAERFGESEINRDNIMRVVKEQMTENIIKLKAQNAIGKNIDNITRLENVPKNKVWFVSADSKYYVFKEYVSDECPEKEKIPFVYKKLDEYGIPHARLIEYSEHDEDFPCGYIIEERLPGVSADRLDYADEQLETLFARYAKLTARYHRIKIDGCGYIGNGVPDTDTLSHHLSRTFEYEHDDNIKLLIARGAISQNEYDRAKKIILDNISEFDIIPSCLTHGDMSMKNIMVCGDELTIIDWDDSRALPWMCDIARFVIWLKQCYSEDKAMRFKSVFLDNYTNKNGTALFEQAEPYLNLYYILDYMIWRYGVDKKAYDKDKFIFDNLLLSLELQQFARDELKAMGIEHTDLAPMQYKDGVALWRVKTTNGCMVLKCFDKHEYRREIENYRILRELNIPTLKFHTQTLCSLLMEDIESGDWRLGVESDLHDPQIATFVARWYRALHERGREYAQSHTLYDECDCLTLENIALIKAKTNTEDAPVWAAIEANFEQIRATTLSLQRTLTYNDYYYTNLAVRKDGAEALIFDYNLLGKGYVYSDIRNVCSSLGDEAKAAFLAEYGEFERREVAVDDVVCPIVSLFHACEKKVFPQWSNSSLADVQNGTLLAAVERLLEGEH